MKLTAIFGLLCLLASSAAAQSMVDARDFGCRADWQKITCALSADGRVTRADGVAFQSADAGKILIIDGARSWPSYSLEPVPLNARITAVRNGVASVESLDETTRGTLVANPSASAEFFTDNTDAIARALARQTAEKLPLVQLPGDGIIGLCPFASATWKQNPVYDSHVKTRAVFVLKNGAFLKGADRAQTRLKIGYFGEFDPIREAPHHFSPVLFMFEPVENQTTTARIEGFTVEFPASPVVQSGYSFAADGWNTSPARHALQVTIRDLATINPQRNTVLINSYQGGIYGPAGELLAESKYVIENCAFETAGGSFKNQNALRPDQRGGKSVHLTNVTIRGGGNIITRHYPDAGSLEKVGGDLFLRIDAPDFTWKDFNAHSDQDAGAFNPNCLVRKAHRGLIRSITPRENGAVEFTVDTGAPVTKAGAPLLINFGLGDKQIYLEDAATLTAGSPVIAAQLSHAQLAPEALRALIGTEIRVNYEENLVKAVYGADSIKRIQLAAGSDAPTLLGQSGLDVTVNFEGARGAFGHTFYVGHNVNFYVHNLQIYDCAKRSFRVSEGGSKALSGAHEFTDYQVHPARGMAAFCNRTTVFTAAEEFGGPLKLRRSKASSVYSVILDMDEHSTYVAQGGILGGSVIRNSAVFGAHAGGGLTTIENSVAHLRLVRLNAESNIANNGALDEGTPRLSLRNCAGSLTFQNGVVEAVNSRLQIGFQGNSEQYEQWKPAIAGRYLDCTFPAPPTGFHDLTPAQREDFTTRQSLPPH